MIEVDTTEVDLCIYLVATPLNVEFFIPEVDEHEGSGTFPGQNAKFLWILRTVLVGEIASSVLCRPRLISHGETSKLRRAQLQRYCFLRRQLRMEGSGGSGERGEHLLGACSWGGPQAARQLQHVAPWHAAGVSGGKWCHISRLGWWLGLAQRECLHSCADRRALARREEHRCLWGPARGQAWWQLCRVEAMELHDSDIRLCGMQYCT